MKNINEAQKDVLLLPEDLLIKCLSINIYKLILYQKKTTKKKIKTLFNFGKITIRTKKPLFIY
jgi:hypothetical protein